MSDPALRGFHHLAIQVRDLRAAERFYCGLLGLRVLHRWPYTDGRAGERSLWVDLGDGGDGRDGGADGRDGGAGGRDGGRDSGGGFLALEACDGGREGQAFRDGRPGLHLIALRIRAADRALWEAKLAAASVPIVHRSAFTLYVLDPEGNRVGLSHHPGEA